MELLVVLVVVAVILSAMWFVLTSVLGMALASSSGGGQHGPRQDGPRGQAPTGRGQHEAGENQRSDSSQAQPDAQAGPSGDVNRRDDAPEERSDRGESTGTR